MLALPACVIAPGFDTVDGDLLPALRPRLGRQSVCATTRRDAVLTIIFADAFEITRARILHARLRWYTRAIAFDSSL